MEDKNENENIVMNNLMVENEHLRSINHKLLIVLEKSKSTTKKTIQICETLLGLTSAYEKRVREDKQEIENLKKSCTSLTDALASAIKLAKKRAAIIRILEADSKKSDPLPQRVVYDFSNVMALSSTELDGERYENPSGWLYPDRDD